jgi:hypothetical protein
VLVAELDSSNGYEVAHKIVRVTRGEKEKKAGIKIGTSHAKPTAAVPFFVAVGL